MRVLRFFLLCAVILVWESDAQAQPQLGNQLPNPRLNTVYPPGGKIGTTVEVTVAGSDFDLPEALFFSHPGITATPLETEPAKEDPKAKGKGKGQKNPAPQAARFSVTIGPDVPVGYHDKVRVIAKHGIQQRARAFAVGDLVVVLEKEP